MTNDRGTKKWTAMMMPEHIQLLDQYWKEQEWKEKPILDEQQINEIGMKLQMAIHNGLTVNVNYFADHDFHNCKGKLLKIDSQNKFIRLEDVELDDIPFDNVMEVTIL